MIFLSLDAKEELNISRSAWVSVTTFFFPFFLSLSANRQNYRQIQKRKKYVYHLISRSPFLFFVFMNNFAIRSVTLETKANSHKARKRIPPVKEPLACRPKCYLPVDFLAVSFDRLKFLILLSNFDLKHWPIPHSPLSVSPLLVVKRHGILA